MSAPAPEYVAFRHVGKSFGPVEVLRDVSFGLRAGEVHALIGENGAGKSTLMKILGGYQPLSRGEIVLDGAPVHFRDSRDAEARGIVLIHQEFNLAEDLTVADNIFLGRELGRGLLSEGAMREGAREALSRLGVKIDPNVRVRDLSVPQKQLVEIAKALSRSARLLIMDEPTATLSERETEALFHLIRRLGGEGVTVLYISHKLNEVQALADRVTVLRDGRFVTTADAADLSQHQMANLMVGREIQDMFPDKGEPGRKELLRVENLSVPGWAENVSFQLRRGEVLGFAGLVGSGRTEAFEGLMGLRRHTVGRILKEGKPIRLPNPAAAAHSGIVYLSEDRKGKGLHVGMNLRANLTLMTLELYAKPLIDSRAEERALTRAAKDYDIRTASGGTGRLDVQAGSLSGGNQQKLALAKILEVQPRVIVLDEPTRGVDVGAKRDIYHLIHRLTREGKGVIVISSELTELLGLCHRILVMREGRIVGELTGEDMTEQSVIQLATGLGSQQGEHVRA